MITYYAAMGKYHLEPFDGGKRPVIVSAGREYGVTVPEYIVWNALLWNILDYDALKTDCLHKAQRFGIAMAQADFDQTLERLLLRGLVIQGQGFTGAAALHELLHDVCLVPVRLSFPRRIAGFFRLLADGYPVRIARHIFGPDKLSREEKQVLKSLLDAPQPVTQFLNPSDSGHPYLSDPSQQFLAAAANLYLKRMVVLERETF